MIRTLALVGGLVGATGLSQFPEFSQQYMQRLSGAVDELQVIAVAFDTTATASGLSRAQALQQMGGSAFNDGLRATMSERLSRYDRLSRDQAALQELAPLQRLGQVWRFADPQLARRTWGDFRPAVPVTADGLLCAGLGFLGGRWMILGLLALPLSMLRRRWG